MQNSSYNLKAVVPTFIYFSADFLFQTSSFFSIYINLFKNNHLEAALSLIST